MFPFNLFIAAQRLTSNSRRRRSIGAQPTFSEQEEMDIEYGLICKQCGTENEMVNGGYEGKPTLCQDCQDELGNTNNEEE